MTLQEIKNAVDNGLTVHWANAGYEVIKGKYEYLIIWDKGGRSENAIGLTWVDGKTMNGQESQFYISQ